MDFFTKWWPISKSQEIVDAPIEVEEMGDGASSRPAYKTIHAVDPNFQEHELQGAEMDVRAVGQLLLRRRHGTPCHHLLQKRTLYVRQTRAAMPGSISQ